MQGQSSVESFASDLVAYGLDVERRTRRGLSAATELRLSQARVAGAPQLPVGRASAALRMTLPLFYDRGGFIGRSTEHVASLQQLGSEFDLEHATALAIRETVAAYWDYLAATSRLEIAQTAESRSERLINETQQMVRAEERPAADLTHLAANLATKRASRISAAQAVVDARQRLGLVIGETTDAIARLPTPVTDWPALDSSLASDALAARSWLALAEARRQDLRGARARFEAGQRAVEIAEGSLQPRLDLSVSLGFEGLVQRSGVGGFVSPLHRNVKGPNASVQLSYRRALLNVDAEGQVLEQHSRFAQQRVALRDLERQIGASVESATHALTNAVLGVQASASAVRLSRETVDNERRKFQLGTSTLFDVLLAEDALTNALLGEIASRRAYAGALLDARFATGTLVVGAAGAPRAVQATRIPPNE